MKPPFSYYGAKGRLAPWIVSMLPEHRVYVEPFAGSAAVLFAKPRAVHEILNDIDGNIVHFFRMLRDRAEDLELACRLTPYSRDEYAAADLNEPGLDDIERARRYWVRVNQSFAKLGTDSTGWSSSISRGSNNARSCWNRIERFAAIADRLGTVTIEHQDALDIIGRYGVDGAVVYVDPPYLIETRSALQRRPGGDYAHEFSTEVQHRALAGVLRESPATVVLSGYHSPLYDELYDGWWTGERRILRRTTNGRSGPNTHVIEVVWSNRPLRADGALFDEATAAR